MPSALNKNDLLKKLVAEAPIITILYIILIIIAAIITASLCPIAYCSYLYYKRNKLKKSI